MGAPFGKTLFCAVARCSRCASRQSPSPDSRQAPVLKPVSSGTRPRLLRVGRRPIGCYEERRGSFVRQGSLTDASGMLFLSSWGGLARHWHAFGTHICSMCGLRRRLNRTIVAGIIRGEWARNGTGTALRRFGRRLGGVYMGLPTTAAVADMPVGAPPPFASALEQAPGRTRTSGARPGSAVTASAARSFARHLSHNPQRRT